MKKLIAIFGLLLISSVSNLYADTMENLAAKFSENAAEFVSSLIPKSQALLSLTHTNGSVNERRKNDSLPPLSFYYLLLTLEHIGAFH